MNAVLAACNTFARVAFCGSISQYNAKGLWEGPSNWNMILMRRITVQGFIVVDHAGSIGESMAEIGAAVKDSAHALLRAAVFRGCEVGVAVYRKKPEYRPGTLVLEEPRFEGCGRETALEPGAVVVRDGEPVRAPPVDEWDSLRPLEALRTRDVDK